MVVEHLNFDYADMTDMKITHSTIQSRVTMRCVALRADFRFTYFNIGSNFDGGDFRFAVSSLVVTSEDLHSVL